MKTLFAALAFLVGILPTLAIGQNTTPVQGWVAFKSGSEAWATFVEYQSAEFLGTNIMITTSAGKPLRIFSAQNPIFIPYPRTPWVNPQDAKTRIQLARKTYPELGPRLIMVEKIWAANLSAAGLAAKQKETNGDIAGALLLYKYIGSADDARRLEKQLMDLEQRIAAAKAERDRKLLELRVAEAKNAEQERMEATKKAEQERIAQAMRRAGEESRLVKEIQDEAIELGRSALRSQNWGTPPKKLTEVKPIAPEWVGAATKLVRKRDELALSILNPALLDGCRSELETVQMGLAYSKMAATLADGDGTGASAQVNNGLTLFDRIANKQNPILEALRQVGVVLDRYSKEADKHRNSADSLAKLAKTVEAIREYQAAIECFPNQKAAAEIAVIVKKLRTESLGL